MRINYDPIERDPKIRPYIEVADIETEKELENHPQRGQDGFFFIFCATKKRILKEKFGIGWKPPHEMNPDILFD
jgi:hypothetical protein